MKIETLELTAFGPFTDTVLDFSSDRPGLHVVYGPNEAGKSSSLRALQALLFGFPHSTGDNFLHAYNQLLVGGTLRLENGHSLTFRRRKKARNDLFDSRDNQLGPEALQPFVQGLNADLFASMYGINHEALVRGGQGILDQHGEVGQILFAAGTGVASLKAIQDDLEAQAGALFRPRASTAGINQSLARYGELNRAVRQASLNGRDWEEQRRALDQAEAELAALRQRQAGALHEISRLERLQRALPMLGRRRQLRAHLADLGEVVLLPEDFARRRQAWEEETRELRTRLDSLQGRQHQVLSRRDRGQAGGDILEYAASIERLHQGLGEYRKSVTDRVEREGQRIEAKTEAGRLLRLIRPDLPLEQARSLEVLVARKKKVLSLGKQRDVLLEALRRSELHFQEQERLLGAARQALDQAGGRADTTPLRQALEPARKFGDLDAELERLQSEGSGLQAACEAALHGLGVWAGPLEELGRLRLPLPATVDRCDRDLAVLDEEARAVRAEEQRLVAEIDGLTRQLREIEHGGAVPSEAELEASRELRDQGWQRIRRRYIDDGPTPADAGPAPDLDLAAAYEQSVAVADGTADRMYREADRVRRQAALRAALEVAQAALERVLASAQKLQDKRQTWQAEWLELWSAVGLTPLAPREMRAWMAELDKLRARTAELDRLRALWRERLQLRQNLRLALLACLPEAERPAAETLAPVLTQVQLRIEAIQAANSRRESCEVKVRDLTVARDNAAAARRLAENALTAWQAEWSAVLREVDLPQSMTPVEVEDALDTAVLCLQRLEDERVLRVRRDGMDRDCRKFENDVRDLSGRIAPQGAPGEEPETAEQTVIRLKGLVTQAVRNQAVLDQLTRELDEVNQELAELRARRSACDEEEQMLYRLAGCDSRETLLMAEERCAAWRALHSQLETVENDLAALADGKSLDGLEEEAGSVDPDALPAMVTALRAEIAEDIEPALIRVGEDIGRRKSELSRMSGGAEAASLREDLESEVTALTRLSGRYLRLKLAEALLRQEIERYREKHQDPLLVRASEHFQTLTLGGFDCLRVELDDKNQPILVGLRHTGQRVYVEGMSAGTRDQLYLSLRLATLELRLAGAEPLPFVVDDILINFDEQRALATLKTLAGLADRMQIVLFTHQRQVADMAAALGDVVFVHALHEL